MGRNKIKGRYDEIGGNRERIYVRLISPDFIGEMIKRIPYGEYLDMIMVYYLKIDIAKDNHITLVVNNDYLKSWGISKEELNRLAWDNTLRDHEAMIMKLHELMRMLGMDISEEIEGLYVISNETREYGAISLFYPDMLEKIADILESDYYVIPSSVHECLLIRKDEKTKAPFLRDMLVSVNQEEVLPKDVLSNNIYVYSRSEKRLNIDIS